MLIEREGALTYEKEPIKKIIMATTSEIKLGLLEQALKQMGASIAIIPAKVGLTPDEREWEESLVNGPFGRHNHYSTIAQILAYLKAYKAVELSNGLSVIASDSAKLLEGTTILAKPVTYDEAVEMILKQSGQTVVQVAGVALWKSQEQDWAFGSVETRMELKQIAPEQAKDYILRTPEALEVAGGIPIFDKAAFQFYQTLTFPTVMKCYNGKGLTTWEEKGEIFLNDNNLIDLTQAVYGFSPPLLKAMGLLGSE